VLKQNPSAGTRAAHAKDVPSAADHFDPTEGMSGIEKFVAGNSQQLSDAVLGAKQFAAKFGLGDKEALAKEAADKAAIDAPLLATGAGGAGAMAGRMALTAPLMTGAGAGAGKLLPSVLKSIGIGAGEGVVKPGEEYSPGFNAAVGGVAGAAGDVGGRVLTKIISPAWKAGSDLAQRGIQRLKDADMPLLIKNVTGPGAVTDLTDALQKLPWFRKGIDATEDAQKRLGTKIVTGAAGTPMEEVGAGALQDVTDYPNQVAKAIRAQTGDIPLGGVPGELRATIAEHAPVAALTGKAPGKMLPNVVKSIENQNVGGVVSDASRGPGILSTIDQAALDSNKMSAVPGLRDTLGDALSQDARAAVTPTMSPDTFMTARANLSDIGFGASGAKQKEALAAQEALENAYRAHAGPEGAAAFDKWKLQHGLAQDIKAASLATGVGGGPLSPQAMAAQLSKNEQFKPTTDLNQFIVDQAAHLNHAPAGANRSAITSLLLGSSPIIGGMAGAYTNDSPVKGAALGSLPLVAAGLLGTQTGAKYLMNQALSPAMKQYIQQLLTTGAISKATTR
jgi:hypothetical protein